MSFMEYYGDFMKRTALQLGPHLSPGSNGYENRCMYLTNAGMHTNSVLGTEIEFMKMLYWIILANKHKKILEFGTNVGHGTWWFIKAAEELDGSVVTVDQNDCYEGIESKVLTRVLNTSAKFCGSRDINDKFNFIYIDGDHSFLGAYTDMINSEALIAPGGTVAIHDVIDDVNEKYMARSAFMEFMKTTKGKWMNFNCGQGMAIGEY